MTHTSRYCRHHRLRTYYHKYSSSLHKPCDKVPRGSDTATPAVVSTNYFCSCCATRRLYADSGRARSSACVPLSTTHPLSMTTMRSAFWTVERRCATTTTAEHDQKMLGEGASQIVRNLSGIAIHCHGTEYMNSLRCCECIASSSASCTMRSLSASSALVASEK